METPQDYQNMLYKLLNLVIKEGSIKHSGLVKTTTGDTLFLRGDFDKKSAELLNDFYKESNATPIESNTKKATYKENLS